MRKPDRWLFATGCMMTLLAVALWLGLQGASARAQAVPSGWTTVFTDTFEGPDQVWAIFQSPEDFSPAGMTTWAVAGPFTPEQLHWEARLQLLLQHSLLAGESVFLGLSDDGRNFQGREIEQALTMLPISWATNAYSRSAEIWLGLGFNSDAAVSPETWVSSVELALNYGHRNYLPLIRRDPTPTPTNTPTPTPTPTPLAAYLDTFNNPASGWFVGSAMRYNSWCDTDGRCNTGWEEVTQISYASSNEYRFFVPHTWHGGGGDVDTWFVWPAEYAPMPAHFYPLPNHYCIEVVGRIVNGGEDYHPWWAHWGIVFAGNAARNDIYTFQINANRDAAILRYG